MVCFFLWQNLAAAGRQGSPSLTRRKQMEAVETTVEMAVPVRTAYWGMTPSAGEHLFHELQDLIAGTARAGGSRPDGGPGCASA